MATKRDLEERTDLAERHERPAPDEAPVEEHRSPSSILVGALKSANRHHVPNLAAALAYYAFLAIPSALLLAVGIFGLLASPGDVNTVVEKLGSVIPGQAQTLLRTSLQRMTENRSTGLTVLLVGGALALWSLSGAMQNLMWALNGVYERDETRGFVRRRLLAFAMIFFALLGFGLAFGALVLGPHLSSWIGDALGQRRLTQFVWWIAEWPLLAAGLLLCFGALLYLGPNAERPRWRFLSLGAVTALVIWLVASGAFAFYTSRFGSYNKAWGALAAVVIMLTWLWLSSVALLLGAEIDAEAERRPIGDGADGAVRQA
jgi:membrane protein